MIDESEINRIDDETKALYEEEKVNAVNATICFNVIVGLFAAAFVALTLANS